MEADLNALQPELDAALHAVAEAMGRAGADRLPLLGRAIELAQAVQQSNLEAFLRVERAFLLTGNSATVWAADVARLAEVDLRRAVELTAMTGDCDLHSHAAMNLATILGNKGSGDRSENLEEAIGLIRDCLASSSEQSQPDLWAMYCTNLSVLYVNRRRGNRAENLREAERLCQAALRVRSIERDPVDWAYTATNLAHALITRARIGDGAPPDLLERALLLSEQAATASAGVEYLAAGALQNAAAAARAHVQAALHEQARGAAEAALHDPEVASVLRRSGLTDGSAADRVVQIARLAKENPGAAGFASTPGWVAAVTDPVMSESDRHLLDRAVELSARARSIRARSPGVDLAMSCKQWDDLLLLAGAPGHDRAEVLEEGLALLAVDDLPHQVLEIADRLGAIHSENQEWARAADAYANAIAALDWIYQELSGQRSRVAELTTNYKLVELAVYAMAMAGRADEAVLLLENGRTRELGADVARDSAAMGWLRTVMPALEAELQQVQRRLGDLSRWDDGDEGTPEPSGPGRASSRLLRQELQRVIDRIRGVDGFADFMTGVSAREVAAVSRPDRPLAYLVASPAGSLVLLVEPGDAGTGPAGLDVTVLRSGVTSAQLVCCVSRIGPDGPTGVLISSGEELDVEIGRAQELLGAAFGQNLFDALSASGATGVQLVATGILATLPVSTALAVGPDGPQPLSELLTVSLVPSAHVHQVCQERMRQRARRPRLLVCASDPEADDPDRALPYSRSEVRAIGRLYGAAYSRVCEGAAATKSFLVENAGEASHLHLSLHGFSDVVDAMRSGVVMADGPMTVAEFRESAELTAQVVVVSACESGRISIRDAPNEFRGLPFGLIACGAAGVVASLWPVNDLATSLLMVRFHEVLLDLEDTDPLAPDLVARALRAAQAWLRSANHDDVLRFMRRHGLVPGGAEGDARDRGLRQLLTRLTHRDSPTTHPFGAARHWASFVAIG
jgi:CHAT domain-containing protein/tetratricopeptide (TPR) repeat protein